MNSVTKSWPLATTPSICPTTSSQTSRVTSNQSKTCPSSSLVRKNQLRWQLLASSRQRETGCAGILSRLRVINLEIILNWRAESMRLRRTNWIRKVSLKYPRARARILWQPILWETRWSRKKCSSRLHRKRVRRIRARSRISEGVWRVKWPIVRQLTRRN